MHIVEGISIRGQLCFISYKYTLTEHKLNKYTEATNVPASICSGKRYGTWMQFNPIFELSKSNTEKMYSNLTIF